MLDTNDNSKSFERNKDLKYQKWYDLLINKALKRTPEEGVYYEKHHIVPKSLGGSNKAANLVKLTAREHIVAHKLLVMIYPNNRKLKFALNAMTLKKTNRDTEKLFSTRELAIIREEAARAKIGYKHSLESRQKMSKSRSGKKLSDEHRKHISEGNKGKKRTKEQLKNYHQLWKPGHTPWNKGKVGIYSDEYRKKISESKKNISDETRRKLSEAAKKRGFRGKTKKVIDPNGVVYESTEGCARAYKVAGGTIRNWIKKNPKKGFKFLD